MNDKPRYIVGRIQSDLELANDTSVSREHAIIHCTAKTIKVEDKSKYGVYVNGGIDTNKGIDKEKVSLNRGDIIRFGRLKNTFRVEKIDLKVCQSTMEKESAQQLASQLKILGGCLVGSWDRTCTHLVMPTVTVTVKVLQSLVCGTPIVTPTYWDEYIQCAREQRTNLPNVNDFTPEISELYIIKEPGMMQVHLDRQRIFRGKTFVFMVKRHMLNFQSIIELAGGACTNLEEKRLQRQYLLKTDYIPVAYTAIGQSQCSQNVNGIVDFVETNGRRMISESEIGLAIIHRSSSRFCNPDHAIVGDFQANTLNTNELKMGILVEQTPQSVNTPAIDTGASVHIAETINLTETEPNNNLRDDAIATVDSGDDDGPSTSRDMRKKKPVTPKKSPVKAANQKRKRTSCDNKDEKEDDADDELTDKKAGAPQKKAKMNEEAVPARKSLSSDLMPPPPAPQQSQIQSQSQNVSLVGFISTQSRRLRSRQPTNESNQTSLQPKSKEKVVETRKRVISDLNADSDEETGENDDGDLFSFGKSSVKRLKTTSNVNSSQNDGKRHTVVVNDDDNDDENLFNFSSNRSARTGVKKNSNESRNSEDIPDNATNEEINSFSKPYLPASNKDQVTTFNIKSETLTSTQWITRKMKTGFNLNETTEQNTLVQIKKEKLEDDETTGGEEKREWVQSLANVFRIRTIDVNRSRQTVSDETDSIVSDMANTSDVSISKKKNFKKFVKVCSTHGRKYLNLEKYFIKL